MANPNVIRGVGTSGYAPAIDAGLRAHMNKVYGLMSVAMLITGTVAYVFGTTPALLSLLRDPNTFQPNILGWIAMFAPLAVVFFLGASINRLSQSTAQVVFWGFSALMGVSISYIFAVYTGISIAQTFFVTAIAFSALSLYGYTTKRDISAWRGFLIMGVVGLLIASIINIFLGSPALHFAVSSLGVLIFAGLTAYDTQNIKNTYIAMAGHGQTEWLGKAAVMGALNLYLNFLNMFMFLLQFLGSRE